MEKWNDIKTAPRDKVILTDQGLGIFKEKMDNGFFYIPFSGWYLCSVDGDIPECIDNGISISGIDPKVWQDFDFPKS